MYQIISAVVTAIAYLYFNHAYFGLASALLSPESKKGRTAEFAFFAVNYLLFFACSILQLPLMLNWFLFLVFLFCETLLYYGCGLRTAAFLSMQGILCGVTANIFNRCLFALLLNRSLSVFDNNIHSSENLKAYPVLLGFAITGAVLQLLTKKTWSDRLRPTLSEPMHMNFLLRLMTVMYLDLLLNLLLYNIEENVLIMKLWGMASCVFVCVGYDLGLKYTVRLCFLSQCRRENEQMREQLSSKGQEEKDLFSSAYTDDLTGIASRKYAELILPDLLNGTSPYCLCFIDLDDLKGVNDAYGHSIGDLYILTAAENLVKLCRKDRDHLFRYGGDEFLLLLFQTDPSTAEKQLHDVNARLSVLSARLQPPVPMSISFGCAGSTPDQSPEELLREADQKMYQQKRRSRADN